MKDNEKQIEIKDKQWQRRDNYCLRIQKALQYKGTDDNEDVPSILVDFENEIRKEISKDSVVLSREEYEKLKYTWITDSDAYKKGSNETAEKILITVIQLSDMCRDFYEFQNRLVDLIGTNYDIKVERKTIISAKQFGVEIKE